MEFKPPPPPSTPPRTFKSPVSKPASIKTPSPLKSPEPTGKSSTKSSPSDSNVSKSPVIPLLYSAGSNQATPSSSIGSSPVFETPPSRVRTPSVTTPSRSDSPQIVYQSNPNINQKSKFLNNDEVREKFR